MNIGWWRISCQYSELYSLTLALLVLEANQSTAGITKKKKTTERYASYCVTNYYIVRIYAYAYGELVGMVTGAINYSKALVM